MLRLIQIVGTAVKIVAGVLKGLFGGYVFNIFLKKTGTNNACENKKAKKAADYYYFSIFKINEFHFAFYRILLYVFTEKKFYFLTPEVVATIMCCLGILFLFVL